MRKRTEIRLVVKIEWLSLLFRSIFFIIIFLFLGSVICLSKATCSPARSSFSPDSITYLRCNWLTGRRGADGQVDAIVAHERVAIDHGEQHGRGNYAIYTGTNELLVMVGTFDLADTNRLLPYLYASHWTNDMEVVKWLYKSTAIIYDRRRDTLSGEGGSIFQADTDELKGFSPTAALDLERPKKSPLQKK